MRAATIRQSEFCRLDPSHVLPVCGREEGDVVICNPSAPVVQRNLAQVVVLVDSTAETWSEVVVWQDNGRVEVNGLFVGASGCVETSNNSMPKGKVLVA